MSIRNALFFLFIIFSCFVSCATNPNSYEPIDADVHNGSYENALAAINNENGAARKDIYTTRNEILLYLDRGMINHYAGLYMESSRDFQMAEQLIEEAYTKSMSQEIGSFLLNDNVRNYSGEDYEDLYINVFGALNYYNNGDIEGALVEIRRLNEKLVYLADRYERAKDKIVESNDQVDTASLPMEASRYSNSALARYLGMLFFRGTGKNDDARIDYEELIRAYDLAPDVYTHSIPSSAGEELAIPGEKGRLNVIAFTGLSPVKVEESITIPLPLPFPNNSAKLALPVMIERPSEVNTVEVVLNTGEKFTLELIEDMSAVARETFKSKQGLIILKASARSISKAVVSAVAAETVSQKQGLIGGLIVGAVGRIAADASEQADLRLSRYFPSHAYVGGINLEPGTYTVAVNYYGNGGLLHSEKKDIAVRRNTLNLGQFFLLR